jgi:hypothetical protein
MQSVKYPSIISGIFAISIKFYETYKISLRINQMKENRHL